MYLNQNNKKMASLRAYQNKAILFQRGRDSISGEYVVCNYEPEGKNEEKEIKIKKMK